MVIPRLQLQLGLKIGPSFVTTRTAPCLVVHKNDHWWLEVKTKLLIWATVRWIPYLILLQDSSNLRIVVSIRVSFQAWIWVHLVVREMIKTRPCRSKACRSLLRTISITSQRTIQVKMYHPLTQALPPVTSQQHHTQLLKDSKILIFHPSLRTTDQAMTIICQWQARSTSKQWQVKIAHLEEQKLHEVPQMVVRITMDKCQHRTHQL